MLQGKNLFLILLLLGIVNSEDYLDINKIYESIPYEKKKIIKVVMKEFGKVVAIEMCKVIIQDYREYCEDIINIHFSLDKAPAPPRIDNRKTNNSTNSTNSTNSNNSTNSIDNDNEKNFIKKLRAFLNNNKIASFFGGHDSKRRIEIFIRKIMRLL